MPAVPRIIYLEVLFFRNFRLSKAEEFAAAFLSNLERLLGKRAMANIRSEIEETYFGRELSFESSLVQRPELFERAFAAVLGSAAAEILKLAMAASATQLGMDATLAGSNPSSIAGYLELLAKSDRAL